MAAAVGGRRAVHRLRRGLRHGARGHGLAASQCEKGCGSLEGRNALVVETLACGSSSRPRPREGLYRGPALVAHRAPKFTISKPLGEVIDPHLIDPQF